MAMAPTVLTVIAVLVICSASCVAQLDVGALAEAYTQHDLARNEGRGNSDNPDSGALGWGEGAILDDYMALWQTTGDRHWLGKVRDHFERIMGNASDPDGDGYLSWQTTGYSTGVAWTERLHNVSDAIIEPTYQQNRTRGEFEKATGHTYLIEFHEGPEQFRITDWTTREIVADAITYESGEAITLIEPFRVTISGETHQGDRFRVRTVAPEPLEFTVHQGMFLHPVALFIEAVRNDPDLQPSFGGDADRFLAFINTHVFEKNERDWLDMGEMGGAYRFEPKVTDRFPNRIMPHNQYAALARAWLVLGDLEGAHPLMSERAEQMVRFFRTHLLLDEENDAWRWRYWDWVEFGEPGHSGWEDTSHAHIDVSFAIEAARRGVIFTDEDMQRLANTWLEVMWNGDEEKPLFANRVAEDETFNKSPLTRDWCLLSQWDVRAYELALTAYTAAGQPAVSAPVMLLCAQRAGALEADEG
ncbi:MAG: hypothetical protein ACOX9R_19995 [Armatimonadota bacterium]|jgi:hypothetical protein